MRRDSYIQLYSIYKYLYDHFPGITKLHLIQICSLLHTERLIPELTRRAKRSKRLIVELLNKHEKIILPYISHIGPFDKSGERIANIKGKKGISWKFLNTLERPSIQIELGAENNLDQNHNTNNLDQIGISNIQAEIGSVNILSNNDNTNNLYRTGISNIQAEIGAENILINNDNTNNLYRTGISNIQAEIGAANILSNNDNTNIIDPKENETMQAELGAENTIDQNDDTNGRGQIGNSNIEADITTTNAQDQEENQFFQDDEPEDIFLMDFCSTDESDPFSSSLLGTHFE